MKNALTPLVLAGATLAALLLAAPAPAAACGGSYAAKPRGACPYDKGSTSCCAKLALPPPATRAFGFAPQLGFTRNPGEGTAAAFGLTFSTPAAFVPGTKLGANLRVSGLTATNGQNLQGVVDARIGYLGWGSAALLVGGGASYGEHLLPAPKGGMVTVHTGAAVVRTGVELGLFGKLFLELPFDVHVVPTKGESPAHLDWDMKLLAGWRFAL